MSDIIEFVITLQEEVFRARKKRERKGKKGKQGVEGDGEEELEEQLACIPRPKVTDLLPVQLTAGIWRLLLALPSQLASLPQRWQQYKATCSRDKQDELSSDEEREGEPLIVFYLFNVCKATGFNTCLINTMYKIFFK